MRNNSQLLLLLFSLVMLAGCLKMELPSSAEVKDVFIDHSKTAMLEEPVPDGVPVLDAGELGGWRRLCDQCHQGPSYSSHTFLEWSHYPPCQTGVSCLDCHGRNLHRLDVRGSKGKCFDCHLETGQRIDCAFCHTEGWGELHTPADHTLDSHGAQALDETMNCASCHGSNNWCVDCHGVQMPHPDTILHDHPALVRGQPGTCATCHGENSCESCHSARGVGF